MIDKAKGGQGSSFTGRLHISQSGSNRHTPCSHSYPELLSICTTGPTLYLLSWARIMISTLHHCHLSLPIFLHNALTPSFALARFDCSWPSADQPINRSIIPSISQSTTGYKNPSSKPNEAFPPSPPLILLVFLPRSSRNAHWLGSSTVM